jgi:hypothetical protein
MKTDRAALFRKHALDAESKAFRAQSEPSRRAWMIVARDWTLMAEREELKYLETPDSGLAPQQVEELEDAIRQLAASRIRP